ncbi:MAG: ABC transporter permease, partial [Planctomyces sp.]
MLGSVLARTLSVRPGDTVQIEVSGLSHQATVAGIARQYNSGGMILMMNRKAAAKVFPIRQIHDFGIRAEDALRSKVGDQLRQFARDHELIFQSMADLRSQVGRMINGITSRLWMILALALVIAAFGIVNTLTMNVIQQTRQLGVLRVIGMTRAQVIRMFLLQAFTTGVVSIVPGLVMGTFLAWLITTSFRSVADHGVVFSLQPLLLIGYLAGGVCL